MGSEWEKTTNLYWHKLVVNAANVGETRPVTQNRLDRRFKPLGHFTLGVCKLPELSSRPHENAHAGPIVGKGAE
jgi:hypothetical protein